MSAKINYDELQDHELADVIIKLVDELQDKAYDDGFASGAASETGCIPYPSEGTPTWQIRQTINKLVKRLGGK